MCTDPAPGLPGLRHFRASDEVIEPPTRRTRVLGRESVLECTTQMLDLAGIRAKDLGVVLAHSAQDLGREWQGGINIPRFKVKLCRPHQNRRPLGCERNRLAEAILSVVC